MTPTMIITICVLAYFIGFIITFTLIGKCNYYGNENEITSIEEALAWSLLSWGFILIIILALVFTHVSESQSYKSFKTYFESGFR